MPRDLRKTCFDILQAVEEIEEFTKDKTLTDYQTNRMLKLAVERDYEIIGEALRRMQIDFPKEFQKNFRRLPTGGELLILEIFWHTATTQFPMKLSGA